MLLFFDTGNNRLERLIQEDTNWVSGPTYEYTFTLQRCLAIVMFTLRQKSLVGDVNDVTPLEQLIFAQNKQKDELKVVPKVTSYINHAFNKSLSVLSCRLLKRFADVSIFLITIKKKIDILCKKKREIIKINLLSHSTRYPKCDHSVSEFVFRIVFSTF